MSTDDADVSCTAPAPDSPPPSAPVLWALRILVKAGVHTDFLQDHGYSDLHLAETLGLHARTPQDRTFDDEVALEQLRLLHESAERHAVSATLPPVLAANLARLAQVTGISAFEQQLLGFAVLAQTDPALESLDAHLGPLTPSGHRRIVAIALGVEPNAVARALAVDGALHRCGLLDAGGAGASLAGRLELPGDAFAERLVTEDLPPSRLVDGLVAPAPRGRLDDFPHVPDAALVVDVLREAVAARRTGVNVLVWGPSGLGKGELVRAIATASGATLSEVVGESQAGQALDGRQRLRALRLGQQVFARRDHLLAFDRFDDLTLAAGDCDGDMAKGAFLRLLDDTPVPTIWVADSREALDPAMVRRFHVVLEVPPRPARQRRREIAALLGEGAGPGTLRALAGDGAVTQEVLERAWRVAGVTPAATPQAREAVLRRLVSQSVRAQSGRTLSFEDGAGEVDYEPSLVNADVDLAALTGGIARTGTGRLLLWGPPGTGKSLYGRQLADALGRPVQIERGSTLVSKYVGETELRIANAFEQARRDRAVLLLDEADSFLRDRARAERGYEADMVNELLVQVDEFRGVLVLTTNHLEILDPAILRRVDLKVRFGYLNAEQAAALLRRHGLALGLGAPTGAEITRLRSLPVLTPGDFAAVSRQSALRGIGSIADFVDALEKECRLKRDMPARRIGFVA